MPLLIAIHSVNITILFVVFAEQLIFTITFSFRGHDYIPTDMIKERYILALEACHCTNRPDTYAIKKNHDESMIQDVYGCLVIAHTSYIL